MRSVRQCSAPGRWSLRGATVGLLPQRTGNRPARSGRSLVSPKDQAAQGGVSLGRGEAPFEAGRVNQLGDEWMGWATDNRQSAETDLKQGIDL